MARVQALRPCGCGKPSTRREIEFEGEVIGVMVCDECCLSCCSLSGALLDKVRPVFEAMLAADVPKGVADETMTFLLDRIG